MEVRALNGAALADAIEDVARLRISVFRHWPYLYDGDLDYEAAYLRPYLESDKAIIVGAFDGGSLVGASTGAPLAEHADDFADAFDGSGKALRAIYYFAESVLLPEYRGRGIGHAFFDAREAHARALGYAHAAFCSVIRPANHPARPESYRPLDGFWRARGYAPLDGVVGEFSWKDIGDDHQTAKPLQFWFRDL